MNLIVTPLEAGLIPTTINPKRSLLNSDSVGLPMKNSLPVDTELDSLDTEIAIRN